MKAPLIASVLLATSSFASATDVTIHGGMFSYHVGDKYSETLVESEFPGPMQKKRTPLNQSNHQFIALEYNSYIVGYLKNSFNDDTIYVGKIGKFGSFNDYIDLGYTYGAIYGYEVGTNESKMILPMFIPQIHVKYKSVGFNIGYMPIQSVFMISFNVDL